MRLAVVPFRCVQSRYPHTAAMVIEDNMIIHAGPADVSHHLRSVSPGIVIDASLSQSVLHDIISSTSMYITIM